MPAHVERREPHGVEALTSLSATKTHTKPQARWPEAVYGSHKHLPTPMQYTYNLFNDTLRSIFSERRWLVFTVPRGLVFWISLVLAYKVGKPGRSLGLSLGDRVILSPMSSLHCHYVWLLILATCLSISLALARTCSRVIVQIMNPHQKLS
jgi:hypothetical protein